MKIQLVNSPAKTDWWVTDPHLGLLSITSYLKNRRLDAEIEMLNLYGELPECELVKKIGVESDIVGISYNVLSYNPKLADIAKEQGAKVVCGGPYPSVRAKEILQNQKSIDAVVIGDGEEPFYQFCLGKDFSTIPNLFFRDANSLVASPKRMYYANIDELPFDLSLIDPSNLQKCTEKSGFIGARLHFPVYSMRGCTWKEKTGGCVYCTIDGKTRIKSPQRYWKEINDTIAAFGVNYIRDVADDVPSIEWLKELLAIRPNNLSEYPKFFRMIGVRHITPESVELLSELNYKQVFIGFESGDDTLLKTAGKGTKAEQNIIVAELLAKHAIMMLTSWVLGLEGESEKTLETTLDMAKRVAQLKYVFYINAPILTPFPGSPAFKKLSEKIGDKYAGKDEIDFDELKEDWVANFCCADFNTIKAYQEKFLSILPGRGGIAYELKKS